MAEHWRDNNQNHRYNEMLRISESDTEYMLGALWKLLPMYSVPEYGVCYCTYPRVGKGVEHGVRFRSQGYWGVVLATVDLPWRDAFIHLPNKPTTRELNSLFNKPSVHQSHQHLSHLAHPAQKSHFPKLVPS